MVTQAVFHRAASACVIPVSSAISDLLMFVSYFASQSKGIKFVWRLLFWCVLCKLNFLFRCQIPTTSYSTGITNHWKILGLFFKLYAQPVSILTHQTQCSDSLLLERRPYQTHQKSTWRHEIRRMRPKNAQDACRVHPALDLNHFFFF